MNYLPTFFVAAGIALALFLLPVTRKYVLSPFGTLIHEYGHVVANLVTLGKPTGIKIFWGETGGVTHSLRAGGLFNGLGMFISGIAGYPAPIILGVALICSVTGGYGHIMSLGMLILTGFCTFLMRSFVGFFISVISLGFYFSTWSFGNSEHPFSLYLAGSIYLIMGLQSYFQLTYHYFRGNPEIVETDLGIIKDNTYIPMWISWLFMTAGILVACFFLVGSSKLFW